jgi:hypothetical protein
MIALLFWMLLLTWWMSSSSASPTLRRFSWGASGGSLTGLQNFLKDSLTLLHVARADPTLPVSLPLAFYVLTALAAASAFGGLLLLTACMKRYDATYSSAMFVGSFVVSASMMSAAHYQTFQHLASGVEYFFYPVGVLVLMAGVYLLVLESQQHEALIINQDDLWMPPDEVTVDDARAQEGCPATIEF